jgi:hypothetical protein
MDGPLVKKRKNRSNESSQKKKHWNQEKRKDATRFLKMCKEEFPKVANSLTKKTLPSFLLKLAGYGFDETLFQITSRPLILPNEENTGFSMDLLELEVLRQVNLLNVLIERFEAGRGFNKSTQRI